MPLLIGCNFRFVLKRQADVIQPVQQALPDKFIHRKSGAEAVVVVYFTLFEINRELISINFSGSSNQYRHFFFRKLHRQEPVLRTVVGENIGERGGDDRSKPEVCERPHRVFARGPATEVLARNQNGRSLIPRLVQHEVGILLAGGTKAPVIEEELPESGFLDSLQKLLGNDLVGIHIDPLHRSDQSTVCAKRSHFLTLQILSNASKPK